MTPSQLINRIREAGFTASETIHIIATYVNVDIETLNPLVLSEYIKRWKRARHKFEIYTDDAY